MAPLSSQLYSGLPLVVVIIAVDVVPCGTAVKPWTVVVAARNDETQSTKMERTVKERNVMMNQ